MAWPPTTRMSGSATWRGPPLAESLDPPLIGSYFTVHLRSLNAPLKRKGPTAAAHVFISGQKETRYFFSFPLRSRFIQRPRPQTRSDSNSFFASDLSSWSLSSPDKSSSIHGLALVFIVL